MRAFQSSIETDLTVTGSSEDPYMYGNRLLRWPSPDSETILFFAEGHRFLREFGDGGGRGMKHVLQLYDTAVLNLV